MAILLQLSFANWIVNHPIVSPLAPNWHIDKMGDGGSWGPEQGGFQSHRSLTLCSKIPDLQPFLRFTITRHMEVMQRWTVGRKSMYNDLSAVIQQQPQNTFTLGPKDINRCVAARGNSEHYFQKEW